MIASSRLRRDRWPVVPAAAHAAALVVALLLAACGPTETAPVRGPTPVGASAVTTGPAQPPVLTSGVITTREELRLSFKIAGIVRSIDVNEGEAVRAGQQLAALELVEVNAQLEQARQLADKAERDLARSTKLRADEVISEEELEALRTQAAVARAALRGAEFNRTFATIVAPRDGVVLRKLVEEREFVQPGKAVLVVGPKDGGYIVRAGLSDRDVVRVRLGDAAAVTTDAFPGQALKGRVTVLPGAADAASGLFAIEVELDSASVSLVSGLAARLRIDPSLAGESTLPYAPIAAVIEADGDQASVFVVEDGKARRRPVRVAFIAPTSVAIADGLKPGEMVVTDGALYLEDGEAIQITGQSDGQVTGKIRSAAPMTLLEYPIRRWQPTLVAFLCLVAMGIYAFLGVPREEDPYFKISGFIISVILPGADPVELEQLVAKPLEDRLAELDDVKEIETTVVDNLAVVQIEFEAFTDPEDKYDEVQREINALRPELPAGISRLEIRKFSPALVNTVQFALVSETATYRELEDQARALKDRLKTVEGIRTAETWAFPQRELRIEVDQRRMAELNISPGVLVDALQGENSNLPAGTLDLGSRSFTLKTSGSYSSLDQVRDTVVAGRAGSITRVQDIAKVFWADQPWSYVGRFNGTRAVFVTANQKDGYNILRVREGVAAVAEDFAADLPGRIRLEWGFDQSRNVATRLNRLSLDLAIAIALVSITLLPLGLRAAGIVMLSIPLSLSFGLACIYFLGFSLNQLSIAGFVLALGLLVDDSIVVVENISRHLRLGYSRAEAALKGTQQISQAIVGCTAALLFAFLPLMVLPETAGKFIRVLPLTVVSTIIGSLLIALFIIPFIASRVLQPETGTGGNRILQRMMGLIERWYRPALEYCLARPRRTAIVAIGGSLALTALLVPVVGSSLFPKANAPMFIVKIETPNGSSLAATDAALRFVEARVAALPDVASYFANLGHGNPQIYYNQLPREDSANYAEVFVQLSGYSTRGTPPKLEALRRDLARYPNARIDVEEFVNGPPITAPIAVRIVGPDLATLEDLAGRVEALIRKVLGTQDVDNPLRVPRTNLRLAVDPQKANQLGVPTEAFDQAVRLSVSGLEVGKYKETDGEQYAIVVRTPVGIRPDLETLGEIRVPSSRGDLLPLSQLANLQFEKAPTQIQRYDRERSVTINADVERGLNTAKVTAAVVRELERFEFPRGYRYVLGGEAQSGSESFSGVGTAAIVAIFGIFAVLVLEFGSFKSTLIVLTVVPIGLVGGFLALLLTGNSVSFTASIGLIALIGIEIKNSILLVDFTNQLRAQGVGLDEAIERAGETRFVPILLTSATAIGGLLPLALQNVGLYSPMAWVIIGGLVTSTFLARLVTPVMYKLFTPDVEVKPAPFT